MEMEKDKAISSIQDVLQENARGIERIHGDFWDARNGLAKHMISLASASLVLTVTFAKSFAESASPQTQYLLITSWIAFILTILLALISLRIALDLKSFQARFFNQRGRVKELLEAKHEDPKSLMDDFQEIVFDVLKPMGPKDKWAGRCLTGSYITFVIALILLGAFGISEFAT